MFVPCFRLKNELKEFYAAMDSCLSLSNVYSYVGQLLGFFDELIDVSFLIRMSIIKGFTSEESAQIQQLRQIVADDPAGTSWDLLWKNNLTPWDRGETQLPLRNLLKSGKIPFPTSGKALVPGCGRGYDAVYIASKLGLETVGMDISETAIEAANQNLKKSTVPDDAKISFQVGDFFKLQAPEDHSKFDLCYDYTFFVALPPSLRSTWGAQMRDLVKSGGYLITLIFPIDGDRPGGPPYSVDTNIYSEVLHEAWILVLEEETTNPNRKGQEKVAVWKRK